jgi:hypothetical protein
MIMLKLTLTLFTLLTSLQINALEYFTNEEYPNVLLAQGTFERGDIIEFTSQVLHNDIETIMLDSGGGNLVSSIEIGYFIREQNINTLVPSQGSCYSACTYAFMGGIFRSIDDNAPFAMHRPYFGNEVVGEYTDGYNSGIITSVMIVTYLIEMGLDPLTASLHLLNERLTHFTQTQQLELNIITALK